MNLKEQDSDRLLDAARQATARAYAPYSRFRVGAAVLSAAGHLYTGANVENASFGLSLCAERAAIAVAVAAEGGDNFCLAAVAVVSEPPCPCAPCGACLQVIREFSATAVVLFQGPEGLVCTSIGDLLPAAFTLTPSL